LREVEKYKKNPLLACLPAGRPGGVHPDRCGIAAERLEAGWWNKNEAVFNCRRL